MSRAASTVDLWRRRAHIAQVLVITIFVAGTVYVADTIVGGSLFHRGYSLDVELSQASGLHTGAPVNYRGQRIGEVTHVRLDADDEVGVIAEIRIDDGDLDIPVDSEFLVRHLSAVGEQYLDVRPRSSAGPMYDDGDTVALADTGVPLGVPEVLADAQHLMRSLDPDDVATIARVTDGVFSDGNVDLRGLAVELETAFELLQELEPALTALVRDAEKPLRTGVDLGPEIRSMLADLEQIAASLGDATPQVRSLVVGATDLLPRLDRWWRTTSPEIRELLERGVPLTRMAAEHLRGLHHWLDWVPLQADAMTGSTRDGSGRVILVPKILDNCIYEPNRQRSVDELEPRPPTTDVRCTDPPSGTQQRGSRNVPQQ